jgi:hypothetical protein
MIAYKYRGIETFKRDLKTLVQNQIFASPFSDLNDPFEGMCDENIAVMTNIVGKIFNECTSELTRSIKEIMGFKSILGIYSLSKSNNEKLLWSHYASSHRGYCIEYDLDKLKDRYLVHLSVNEIEVDYKDKPQTITIQDINNRDIILRKLFATKFSSWSYEKEIRLIFDEAKYKDYHPSALTGIYFGLNTSDDIIENLINSLTDRDVRFYRFSMKPSEYKLVSHFIHENKRVFINKPSSDIFEILKTKHDPTVENFYIFYKGQTCEKENIKEFVEGFRDTYTTKPSNIYLFDSKSIKPLIDLYPLKGDDYVKFADHLFAWSTFDASDSIWWYPYYDYLYVEYGGKNRP